MQSNLYLTLFNAIYGNRCNSKALLFGALLLLTRINLSHAQGTTCDDPIVIGCAESVIGSTTGIDNDNSTSGAISCQGTSVGQGGQIWFALTPTSTGPVTISTVDATTNYDTKLHLYAGVCGNLACVAANDDFDAPIYSSQITNVTLNEGITYLIRVGGYQSEEGLFSLSISSCIGVVEGCTDAIACNFDPSANQDDGSCIFPGCNVPDACNYDSNAGCDDGSCCFSTCNTITVTSGFNPEEIGWAIFAPNGQEIAAGGAPTVSTVCVNDPSCDYTLNLTDSYGDGWNFATYTITSPDGTVEATGTLFGDNIANPNFQTADVSLSLGGAVSGCTDITSTNFNPSATCDNGTCIYCDPGSSVLKVILEDSSGDGWNGAQITLFDASNTELISATLVDGSIDSLQTCVTPGCYSVDVTDGNFPLEISWSILDGPNNIILEGLAGQLIYFGWDGVEGCAIEGCTNTESCNYDSTANVDDGTCISSGCTDAEACNFNELAGCDDGSCCFNSCVNITVTAGDFPGEISWQLLDNSSAVIAEGGAPANVNVCLLSPVCAGIFATYDTYGDGWNGANYTISNGGEIQATGTLDTLDFGENIVNIGDLTLGCTDPAAVNFNASADCEDESCIYSGCNDPVACNYDANATINDNTCTYPGCVDIEACNYSSDAGCGDNSCEYPLLSYLTCSGDCINDTDNDGVCNEIEIAGCSDVSACNFDAAATDPAECIFPLPFLDCLGNCLIDTDDDGVCDPLEILGCTDITACNFDFGATENDGSCSYPEANFDCQGNCINDINSNGICDELENGGCTDFSACNYDPTANVNDNSCIYPGCTNSNACNYDANAGCDDGSCAFPGCTEISACNYDAFAICDDGSCLFPGCLDPVACNYDNSAGCSDNTCSYPGPIVDCEGNCINDTDNDGVCDEFEILGCTDISACNYDANATDNSSCEYPAEFLNCDGSCVNDIDNDGVCDELDLEGCTDIFACNYNPVAVVDDLTCVYPGCTEPSACNFDPAALCSNGACDFGGCTIPLACNYDPFAICPNDAICQGVPGSPCDDGNPFTTGETYDDNCNCVPPVSNTIYDIVAASEVHNTLQVALEASGLNEVLAAPGDYTLFAPTDDAFAALPAGTVDALLADPNGALTEILLYHTIGGVALSGVLENGMVITTLQGQEVVVTIDSIGIFINDAQVIIADIIADNGVVHAIDAVLIPQAPVNNTIFDIISNSPDHNTLETALLAAELESVLLAPGNYTAFAPTDAAFDALPNGLLEALLNDPNGALTAVLVYHAIDSIIPFSGLTDGANLTTMVGEDIVITVNAIGTFVNDALITIADITASNGIVHVIDAVLLPTSNETVSIFDIVDASSNHTILQTALETAGLDGVLSEPGSYTLFAPTNAAFEALPTGTLEALLADTTGALTDILLYHVLGLTALSSELADGLIVTTAQGYDVTVTINENGIFINDAQVILADLIANNGVVHVIDAVLIPEVPVSNTIYDIVAASTVHNTLQAALEASGLDEVLAAPGDYTLFAPTDDAFAALPAGTLDALLADPSGALTDILLYHVLGFSALSGSLSDGLMVTTLQGQDVVVTINANGVFINDAQVIIADIIADNGVVHVIDAVLIPEVPVGCTDPTACNYDANAVQDDGTCVVSGCLDAEACNYNGNAGCDNGSCIFPGCTDSLACNYDAFAVCSSSICFYPDGCTDVNACNYNPSASCNDGSCEYSADEFYDCDGNCYFDTDGDGICDAFETSGCTDPSACNYSPFVFEDDGSCVYPGCTDTLACNFDFLAGCDDGTCSFPGCTVFPSCNYNPEAGCDDGSCVFGGCADSAACNYDEGAQCDDGSCYYSNAYFDCDSVCYNDANTNGICDEFEVPGCTDPGACNYSPIAIIDNGLCTYPGCDDSTACNYVGFVGCPDSSCIYPGCTDATACNFNPLTICDDGSCIFPGCQDSLACNYDPAAACNGFNCLFANFPFDCSGNCVNDTDGDLTCDELEILGCTDSDACNFNPEATEENGTCTFPPTYYNCDNTCINDQDSDGICDAFETTGCTDSLACNYNPFVSINDFTCTYPGCNDTNACNYEPSAGCLDFSCFYPETYFDCNGNCINDFDANGICDEFEVTGCTDFTACNYDILAFIDDGSCSYPGCTDPNACNFDFAAICDDGLCTFPGCTSPEACNYDSLVICDDGSCIFPGCLDSAACNYDFAALCTNNDLCSYPIEYYNCFGECLNDTDGDLVCDELEIAGCLDSNACNFEPLTTDFLDCTYPETYYNCDGTCETDSDNDGICNPLDDTGCTDSLACNYNSFAINNDDNCTYPGCTDTAACNFNSSAACDDGSCILPGCLDTLACNYIPNYTCGGGECSYPGCGDSLACNYDVNAACTSPEYCQFPLEFYDCNGQCLNDTDADGICDSLEVTGCTDENACNYNSSATESIDICTYPEEYYNCDGLCINDADLDGICDVFDLTGCVDSNACNYNVFAVESDNSCTYPGCTDSTACNFDITAGCDDGFCIASGCLDSAACNYDDNAGCENGSCIFNSCSDSLACNFDSNYLCGDINLCTYAEQYYNCEGFCINDQDNDGICDEFDITGCTDTSACNYNPFAIESDGNCTYAFPYYDCNGICINDEDGDGVCTELEVSGCTDFAACNFNPEATEDDASCTFPELYYDCFGNCLQDSDNDSICDALDNTGCLDSSACDYNPFATISNGICNYPQTYYNCDGTCINDSDNDGICDPLEIAGCIIPSACNFNPLATDYDSTCVFPGCTNELACNFDPTAGCDNNTCYLPLPGFLCDGSCDGDSDNDGICDYFETNGCTDSTACNYNPYASVDDFTCTYPGCTDPNACNYDANAGCDLPESCDLPVLYYNCDGSCESDVDADGICDPFEITGCTDPAACNYNPFVPLDADDGSCTEVVFATENITVTSDSFPNGYEWNGALLVTSGEYVWVGTTSAGCDSIVTLTFEYEVVISTADIFSSEEIQVWPNPTRDFIHVRGEFNKMPESIVITDINGKVVITESKSLRMDVSQLEAGLYIMRINSNGQTINKRFEILR